MKYMQNLHTHTTFCDGKNKPEEIITEAINKGFSSIGFSGHSEMYYSPEYGMTKDGTEEYKNEISSLKAKYRDKISVFCGCEYDIYSDVSTEGFDYLIGAVHYLKIGDEIVGIDRSAEIIQGVINKYFGGDGLALAKKYYEAVAEMPKYGNFDIVAHFDIITKNIEKTNLFDITSKEYKNYAFEAISALKGKIPYFEVNTGAIARGYRTTPYPFPEIIKEFKRQGFGATISSDCHDKKHLDVYFKEAVDLLKECGYREIVVYTDDGFTGEKIWTSYRF